MNAVEVRNLSFNYKGAFVFDRLNFSIKKGSFITIVGKGGSGKSTLFNIFSGNLKFDGNLLINKKSIYYNLEKGYLGLISSSVNFYKSGIVIDVLKNKCSDFSRIESVSKKIGIIDILNMDFKYLSFKQRILVMFALQFLLKPKVLVIDNCFSFLDNEKIVIKRMLKRLCKKCTIINITNDVDECLYGQEVLFLSNNLCIKKIQDLDSDDFISRDLSVPFIISLSEKLKFYGLIDKNYFNIERLIDDLWQ